MQNQAEYLLVMCAYPDDGQAQTLAARIIERRLAACVNILPGVISVYEWQGQKEQSAENMLLIKTTQEKYDELQALIVSEHPYELPEVIAVPISIGLPGYLTWVSNALK